VLRSNLIPVATLAMLAAWAIQPAAARAETTLCLQIQAPAGEQEGLRKLVLDELAHHPAHRLVTQDCQTTLVVELFELAKERYLTARINQEVPVRYPIKDPLDLNEKVSTALAQVLSQDPVYLSEDLTHYNFMQRAAHSILKRGTNTYRLELFQTISPAGPNVAFAPGVAFNLTRGADNWQVYARIFFAGWPGELHERDLKTQLLRINTGGEAGIAYEFSALGSWSFYIGAGVGLQYLRFDGRTTYQNEEFVDHRNDIAVTFNTRIGLRFLRIYDFDCDVFVSSTLPLYHSDPDTYLSRFWAPTLQAGLGVGF
jgi:hypothetical protein